MSSDCEVRLTVEIIHSKKISDRLAHSLIDKIEPIIQAGVKDAVVSTLKTVSESITSADVVVVVRSRLRDADTH